MLTWALASPLMSSPDEPAHAIRAAAVVRGDFTGTISNEVSGTSEVFVPEYVAHSSDYTCYAFVNTTVAKCPISHSAHPDALVKAFTTATLNTPVFYAIVGLPTLVLDGQKALYAMRAVVALICSLLLASVFMAVSQLPRSRWALLASLVSLTPMVLFLSGSINPNAVEVCAAAAAFANLLLVFRVQSPGSLLGKRIAPLAVSVFFLVNTRSLSLLWLALVLVTALLFAKFDVVKNVFSRPIAWIGTGVMGVIALAALWWFLTPVGLTTQDKSPPGLGTPWRTAFLAMLDQTFAYGTSWIGVFGWIDTPSPGFTIVVWTAAAAALVFASVVLAYRRTRIALILLGATLIFVPPIVQANLVGDWGYVWQGRYTLAVFVCLLIATGIALDERFSDTWERPLSRLVTPAIVLLAGAQFAAFVWALKRYTVGLGSDRTWIDAVLRPEWQPPFGWITLSVVFVVLLAASVVILVRSQQGRSPSGVGSSTQVHQLSAGENE